MSACTGQGRGWGGSFGPHLLCCVVGVVIGLGATAAEGVGQAHPVPGLVHQVVAQVVAARGSQGQGASRHCHTVSPVHRPDQLSTPVMTPNSFPTTIEREYRKRGKEKHTSGKGGGGAAAAHLTLPIPAAGFARLPDGLEATPIIPERMTHECLRCVQRLTDELASEIVRGLQCEQTVRELPSSVFDTIG